MSIDLLCMCVKTGLIAQKKRGRVLQSNISRLGVGLSDGLSVDSPLSAFIPSVSLI